LVFAAVIVSLAATSPETREITDPKKIASAEVGGAGAVPIDDLFLHAEIRRRSMVARWERDCVHFEFHRAVQSVEGERVWRMADSA